MTNELTLIQRAQIAINSEEYEKKLRVLVATSITITSITNLAGRDQCHAARMALKRERVAIEKDSKAARDEAHAFTKACIAEERRLIGITAPEETRLEALQIDWDSARERERKAREEAERARVVAIQDKIDSLRERPLQAVGLGSAAIETMLSVVAAAQTDETVYAEFLPQAEVVKAATLMQLRDMHTKALAHEAEQARLAEERAEQARVAEAQRLEQIALTRARELFAAEQQQLAEAAAEKERVERARIAAEEQAAKDRQAAAENVAREGREAELRRQQAAANLHATRMSQIHGIEQQVLIAQVGRLGVRKGGTIECLRETLAETERWRVDEEDFGPLTGRAQIAKSSAVAAIRGLLELAEEKAREEADLAARKAEQDAAERRLAEERARLEAEQRSTQVKAPPSVGRLASIRRALADIDDGHIYSDVGEDFRWLLGLLDHIPADVLARALADYAAVTP